MKIDRSGNNLELKTHFLSLPQTWRKAKKNHRNKKITRHTTGGKGNNRYGSNYMFKKDNTEQVSYNKYQVSSKYKVSTTKNYISSIKIKYQLSNN